ncbi:MAG: DUF4199 domain-containing protein [Bacteroidota bacterium]
MKTYILKYGLIVGCINAMGLVSILFATSHTSFDFGELIGYTLMLAAFSVAYLGIKRFRDEALNGSITFGKALLMGLLMTLLASSIYVFTWLIVYYNFVPNFMENYADACFDRMKQKGMNESDIADKMNEIAKIKELYKSPLWVILITYSEVLPVGIFASLLSSLVLRKKSK